MPSSSAFVAAMPSSRPLEEISSSSARRSSGEVAGAIGRDPVGERWFNGCEPAASVLGDDFGAPPAPRERERLMPCAHEAREQLGRLDVRRCPCAGVRVEQRALPAPEDALGTW